MPFVSCPVAFWEADYFQAGGKPSRAEGKESETEREKKERERERERGERERETAERLLEYTGPVCCRFADP